MVALIRGEAAAAEAAHAHVMAMGVRVVVEAAKAVGGTGQGVSGGGGGGGGMAVVRGGVVGVLVDPPYAALLDALRGSAGCRRACQSWWRRGSLDFGFGFWFALGQRLRLFRHEDFDDGSCLRGDGVG